MERELTAEGKKMYDALMNLTGDEEIIIEHIKKSPKKPKPIKEWNPYEVEFKFIKLEILKMIENSKLVIADCDYIINKFSSVEGYMLSDVKVAKSLHHNLIDRLSRVFNGLPAFEDESHLPKLQLDNDPRELHAPEPWYNRVAVEQKST